MLDITCYIERALTKERNIIAHLTLNIAATLAQYCFVIFTIFANIATRLINMYATLRQYCWTPMISVFALLLQNPIY